MMIFVMPAFPILETRRWRFSGLGFGVSDSVYRVSGLGQGLRFRGFGFRVQGLGFRVEGWGFRAPGLGFGSRD